jgi:uncharacterized membrane protein YfcA
VGIPAIIAVASPLPATIPSTLAAASVYRKQHLVDSRVVRWSVAAGIPATILGAVCTRWVDGGVLVRLTDVILIALGLRLFLVARAGHTPHDANTTHSPDRRHSTGHLGAVAVAAPAPSTGVAVDAVGQADTDAGRGLLILVAVVVGLAAGLLANSGGFLLAPLYLTVVKLPIRRALASSLVVSAALAVPGTIVHAALGHIDWTLVAVFATTSVPLSFAGARVALRIEPARLERFYGAALAALGTTFLFIR